MGSSNNEHLLLFNLSTPAASRSSRGIHFPKRRPEITHMYSIWFKDLSVTFSLTIQQWNSDCIATVLWWRVSSEVNLRNSLLVAGEVTLKQKKKIAKNSNFHLVATGALASVKQHASE